MRLGIVIPALNERDHLMETIDALGADGRDVPVVVADCGSTDGTPEIARGSGAELVTGPGLTSRAAAMNAGADRIARLAPGTDALWFLHADSRAPDGWMNAIADTLADDRVIGGAFDFAWSLEEAPWWDRLPLLLITAINRVRFRITRSYFGDQGIFVRRQAFETVGGFPDRALLEDVVFCRALRRIGRLRLARTVMRTSPRRFVRHGPIRQALYALALVGAERVGVRPERIYAWYNREKA